MEGNRKASQSEGKNIIISKSNFICSEQFAHIKRANEILKILFIKIFKIL